MSYHLAEQNERQSRNHALVFAVLLHLALASLLYLYTSEESVPQLKNTEPVKKEEKSQPQKPQAKTASLLQ
jgi:hypothetical protein